jgi:hypothetical protein
MTHVTRSNGPRWQTVLAWGIVTLIACLALTSCTTTTNDRSSAPAQESTGTSPAEPERMPRPADRDPQEVSVALRQLDACGVFDLDAATAADMPKPTLLPTGPHSCMLVPTANYTPAVHGVEVMVGDGSNQFFQYNGAPVTIGGAKAYEYRHDTTSKLCQLFFPVSFTRAITFEYDTFSDIDTCQVLRQVAEAAVPRLRSPDTITVDTATRPFAAWDGCLFLAQLLGPDAQNYTYQPGSGHDPFSGCETTRLPDSPGSSDTATTPQLEVAYDQTPTPGADSRQIGGGKTAEVRTYGRSCSLIWNQADSGTGNQWYAAMVFKLTAATCDTAAQLAGQAVQLAGEAPSDASAQPQRPLLYQPDDPDSAAIGACIDFGVTGGQADCEPYHPVPVPQGTDQIMTAAATNRNVQCAVFTDAIKTHLGPTLNPLTWGAHCFFVEPTHTLLVLVNVDPDNAPSDYGNATDLYTDRQETSIDGKPAITFWDKHKTSFDIYLSPNNDLARKGNIHIQIEALRGRGHNGERNEITLDATKADTAKQVITQVSQTYFAS